MTKQEIQHYLGFEYVVKDIIEDENELFAFFVSKKHEESKGNDFYCIVGVGYFYFNKITNEKKRLGAEEFQSHYPDRELLKNYLTNHARVTDIDTLLENINKRRHINVNEFEIIMNLLEIDVHKVRISSTDFIHEIIESQEQENIKKLKDFIKRANMEFTQESPNKIVLKNMY